MPIDFDGRLIIQAAQFDDLVRARVRVTITVRARDTARYSGRVRARVAEGGLRLRQREVEHRDVRHLVRGRAGVRVRARARVRVRLGSP